MKGKHTVYVDSVIEHPETENFRKQRGKLILHRAPNCEIPNKLWYSKSILISSNFPGIYGTRWNYNPLRCDLKKLIKNHNLIGSQIGIMDKNLFYEYNKRKMEFQPIEEEGYPQLSQSTRALPKNNFKRITNILSSHKNELKVLHSQNEALQLRIDELEGECEKNQQELLDMSLAYGDCKLELGTQKIYVSQLEEKNADLDEKCAKLSDDLNAFLGELEEVSNKIEKEIIISVACNISDNSMKCARLSLPFKLVEGTLMFTEPCKARINVPRDVIIGLTRESECIQSQQILEKQFNTEDVIRVSGTYIGDFYMDIQFF